jgi:protein SCO1/2
MYSISLDPEKDTPAVLKQYAEAYGVKRGWYFLTGKPEEIKMLRWKLGIYDRDPKVDADRTQHSALLTYGNEASGSWAATPAVVRADLIAHLVLTVLEPEKDHHQIIKQS